MSGFFGGSSSLLDDLFPAAYRGIPFEMPDVREETGRRVVRFLFPGRDDTVHEDLGALDGPIFVTGFVIGEDYVRRAERLRAAFRTPGPGLLTHPWLGDIEVILAEPAEISFSDREIRLARFTASFEPYIESPPAPLDTLGQLFALLDAVREGARSLLRFIFAPVRLALSVVRAAAGFANGMVGLYRSTIGAVRGLIGPPAQLEASFTGLLAVGSLRIDGSYGATLAARIEAPGAIIRAAALPRLNPAVGGFGGNLTAAPLVETAAATRLLLSVASGLRVDTTAPAGLRLAARALVLADAVQLGVQVPFASRGEALAMRALLDGALQLLATDAAAAAVTDPAFAGGLWQGVAALRAGLAQDMSERIGRLPAVETLALPVAAPTWLVAHHLAGDAPGQVVAQYQDLVTRNRPARPARLPAGGVEVLRSAGGGRTA
jgi:prophage DNA circulation protein